MLSSKVSEAFFNDNDKPHKKWKLGRAIRLKYMWDTKRNRAVKRLRKKFYIFLWAMSVYTLAALFEIL